MTTLWIAGTIAGVLIARLFLGDWLNRLSFLSVACGLLLFLFDDGWLSSNPMSAEKRLYLLSAWVILYMGILIASLLWKTEARKGATASSWEQAYLCRLPEGYMPDNSLSNPGWQLFVLLTLQTLLLGASDEFDIGKIFFAAIYLLMLALWLPRILARPFTHHEPLIRWTAAMFVLALFSRLPGAIAGVSTVDWMRDLEPLLNFSWILIGPFAFRTHKKIWNAYLLFLAIVGMLTFSVADQYIVQRGFRTEGLGLSSFLHATDGVVLFGIFMVAPMAVLRLAPRYRAGLAVLAAAFVMTALITGTRSHVGAILAGLLMYFWLTKRSESNPAIGGRRIVLTGVLVGVAAFGTMVQTGLLDSQRVMQRTEEMKGLDFGALTQRLDESLAAWQGFRERPLFGQGLGYKMQSVLWATDNSTTTDLYMIHNFYLYVPLKFGIVGIPVFFGFIVSMIRSAISTFRSARLPFDKAFSSGLASLLVALLVESATAPRFEDRSATALLSILIAMLLSMRRLIATQQVFALHVANPIVPVNSLSPGQRSSPAVS